MKIYSTGQVAKHCRCAPRTVAKWIDSGRLKGYAIPGSRDRRVPEADLIAFMKDNGIPLGELENRPAASILVLSTDDRLTQQLRLVFGLGLCRLEVCDTAFEAGYAADQIEPDCVIVDFEAGYTEGIQVCRALRKRVRFADTILLALMPLEGSVAGLEATSVNEIMRRPFDSALLAERIVTYLGPKLTHAKRELGIVREPALI